MGNFFDDNGQILDDYLKISLLPGSRADYVQGGGGNTSCKFDERMMAIKASGFKLSQIERDNSYAVLDHSVISAFYRGNEPEQFGDVEGAGSAAAKSSVIEIPGLPVLRPSVEAGFHSLLERFVLHTHPVYANLAACSAEGRDIAAKALKDADYSFGYVNYIDPGAKLTFAIRDEQERVLRETGKRPSAIFMQNHGFIATHDDAQRCIEIHDEVNKLIAEEFGVNDSDFPSIALREVRYGSNDENVLYMSNTPHVINAAMEQEHDISFYCEDSLYPDQLVFLAGNITIFETELPKDMKDWAANKCTIYKGTGDVVYSCSREEAQTIEETIAAITFITSNIRKSGKTVITMSDSGKDFISGWESEKYRKSLLNGESK
ncbi:MAG: class II aldolase/adducin family protein [Eubacteriales bacterium]|jgi:rhamnose utilization protein RhaD (predicted bifunctional aldolase and dehydrogenase)|nr:class II aldolase/adducin family protein [Eubacteriales bacterium]MDD4716530.1 class II aldolase/adducin family protein [Eubacteriales bacterium]